MGVPTARTDLSTIAASNSPSGSDTVASGTGPDDYLRAHASLIRANYDDLALKAPLASPTFTGVVSVPDGSVSAPSITNTGDTNTGIYFGAADTMSVAAGGAEVAYFANGVTKAVFRVDVADQYSHTYSQNLTASGSTAGAGFVCAAGSPTKLGSISMAADGRMDLFNQANGAITFGTNATEKARIEADGNMLVGYTSSNGSYKLQVNSQIFATNATVATSDARFKEKVKDLTDGLALVKALRPVSFEWKAQEDIKDKDKVKREKHNFGTGVHIGFIAQEVQAALAAQDYVGAIVKLSGRPEVKDDLGAVIAPAEEFLGLAESSLIALLVKAVQELSAEIDKLKAK